MCGACIPMPLCCMICMMCLAARLYGPVCHRLEAGRMRNAENGTLLIAWLGRCLMMSGHCRHSCGPHRAHEASRTKEGEQGAGFCKKHSTSKLQLWRSKRCSAVDYQNQQHVAVPVFSMSTCLSTSATRGIANPQFAVTEDACYSDF